MKEVSRRKLDAMPFDHTFEVDGYKQLCHATGYEVAFSNHPDFYWCEYIDSHGNYHYGN